MSRRAAVDQRGVVGVAVVRPPVVELRLGDAVVALVELDLPALVVLDPLAEVGIPQHAEFESLVAESGVERADGQRVLAAGDGVQVLVRELSVGRVVEVFVGADVDEVPVGRVGRVVVDVVDGFVIPRVDDVHTVGLPLVGFSGCLLVIGGVGRILEVGDAVLVERDHRREVVGESRGGLVGPSQFDVDAVFLHAAAVDLLVGGSHQHRDVGRDEHVGTLLVEQVEVQRQAVVQPAHLDAQVALAGLLPLRHEVGGGAFIDVAVAAARIAAEVEPARIGTVAADQAVRVADFHLRPPGHGPFPPPLLRRNPSHGHRREESVAVFGRELFRSRVAEVALEQVFVLVVVGHAAHESLRAVGEIRGLDVLALVEQRQRRDGVVAERAVVVHRPFPVEGRVVGVLHRAACHGVGRLLEDHVAGRGVDPRVALARVVFLPVDVERRIGVGGGL